MKARASLLVVAVMAAFATAPMAQTAAPPGTDPAVAGGQTRIKVTYFHGDVRCVTCRKLEAYSRDAIEKTFPAELASGQVVFTVVNTDRPENAHFRTDYGLVAAALVVAEERDGAVLRWTNLDGIWRLVRGDQTVYADYVARSVREYLGPPS